MLSTTQWVLEIWATSEGCKESLSLPDLLPHDPKGWTFLSFISSVARLQGSPLWQIKCSFHQLFRYITIPVPFLSVKTFTFPSSITHNYSQLLYNWQSLADLCYFSVNYTNPLTLNSVSILVIQIVGPPCKKNGRSRSLVLTDPYRPVKGKKNTILTPSFDSGLIWQIQGLKFLMEWNTVDC